jgi:flagellar motor switch protein FliN/FliY
MNPEEIDALVASVQAAKASGQPLPSADPIPTASVDDYHDFGAPMLGSSEVPLDMLLDLTLPVTIELGRTSMTVQEVLRLGRGSVIQLERLAGEPIDVYVGDRKFAEGEVVVLGEHFGVRVTRILATAPQHAQNSSAREAVA